MRPGDEGVVGLYWQEGRMQAASFVFLVVVVVARLRLG
jgi:hypothetical protein